MAKTIFIILLATLSVSAQPEHLTHYSFKRDLTITTKDNGKVIARLTRASTFVLNDQGERIEVDIKQFGKLPTDKLPHPFTEDDWKLLAGVQLISSAAVKPSRWHLFPGVVTEWGEVSGLDFKVPLWTKSRHGYWLGKHDLVYDLEAVYHSFRPFGARVTVKDIDGEELKPIIGTYIPKGAPEVVYPTWKHGSTVGVVIVGFSENEIAAIQSAIDGWNALGLVRFEIRPSGELKVIREETLKASGLDSYFLGVSDGTTLESGTIAIDPRVKDSQALISHTSHELGHSLGFSDCKNCQSIMRRPYKGVNKANGYLSPTDVDIAALGLKVVSKRE